MLCRRIFVLCLYLWISCFMHVCCKNGVDVDYFTDNGILRTKETDSCYSNLYKLYCHIKCGTKIGLCIEKFCYCVREVNTRRKDNSRLIYLTGVASKDSNFRLNNFRDDDFDRDADKPDSREMDELLNFSFRPALRHHIAHFCPNLDIARECIHTCMKEGKPAFCGKDHVCYCGHKYHSRDDTSNNNLADTYAEFKDLYAKYFGTQNNPVHVEKKPKND